MHLGLQKHASCEALRAFATQVREKTRPEIADMNKISGLSSFTFRINSAAQVTTVHE